MQKALCLSKILGTRYRNFSSPSGCHGLAKIVGSRLYVLAITASTPRRGQCRRFFKQAKREFCQVIVLHVDNPILQQALTRYGFSAATIIEPDTQQECDAMTWERKRD